MSSAIDLYQAFRFTKNITTPFSKWDAFKLGLIDKDGTKIRNAESSEEKNAMTKMMILAKNIKRLLGKLPGGKSKIATFAAALLLLKEETCPEGFDEYISVLHEEYGTDESIMNESVLVGKTYTFSPEIFEDIIDTSGAVRILDEMYTTSVSTIVYVQDIITREKFNCPMSMLKELK